MTNNCIADIKILHNGHAEGSRGGHEPTCPSSKWPTARSSLYTAFSRYRDVPALDRSPA